MKLDATQIKALFRFRRGKVKTMIFPLELRLQKPMNHDRQDERKQSKHDLCLYGIEGTLKGTYRVYSRYTRISGLRAHTKGPWFR